MEHTRPTETTHEEERRESKAAHVSDRPPTSEEEADAEAGELDPEVAEHERDMMRRGVEQRGEGRIQ